MKRSIIAAILAGVLALAGPAAFAVPANDNFAAAAPIAFGEAVEVSTAGATTELLEPTPCGNIGATVWYAFTPATGGEVTFSTAGSDFDTVLAVYTGSANPPLWTLTTVDCNDDVFPSFQARLSFEAQASQTYYLQAGGFSGQTGNLKLASFLPGSITGTVTSLVPPDPEAPHQACVDVFTGAADGAGSAVSDPDTGGYVVDGLAPGVYKVLFSSCGPSEVPLAAEWYNDKGTFATADPVTVVSGSATVGIDAVLEAAPPAPPLDGAVTALEVSNVPLKTDSGPIGYTGWVRDVTVTFENVGAGEIGQAFFDVRACPVTSGLCRTIGGGFVEELAEGDSVTRTLRWNGFGGFGDYRLEAFFDAFGDENFDNNNRTIEHYVIVGGTGFGV